ncbi:MAG TPA: hypothetical protein VLA03_02620, partial [Draconibacterium sp.]|nr:hypothetical protein [Draconibacterium sp.]
FLRNPETVWWGTAGTTLKGAVWGLLGGAVLSLGFFFNHIPKKTIIIAFLLMMAGMIAGFNIINDPMIIYFSDPVKPRPESWAALLFGAIALLLFLKFKTDSKIFKIIFRFSVWGLIGGGLGFGLGGLWMVLGSNLTDVIFGSWWKAMEFTFGLLLGASLGYAGWVSRKELKAIKENPGMQKPAILPVWKELLIVLIVGLVTYWLIPYSVEPFTDAAQNSNSAFMSVLYNLGRIVVNYAFYGFLFILIIIRFPQMAWQIGITLTFCHAAIDLIRDFYPDTNTFSPFTMHFFWVLLMTTIVALLVVRFERQEKPVIMLFFLLIWSCVAVSFLRMGIHPERLSIQNLSLCEIICGRFIVDIFFLVSAIAVSWILAVKIKKGED